MVQYISKHQKGDWEMTSLNLKKMNLPRDHQKNVADMVKGPSELHVSSVSDVKAAALSQAATLRQVRMKVDMVGEPSEPQETNGELLSTVGEPKDVMRGDKKVQGRNENIDEMYQQVSQPITTNITVMFSVLEKYEAVKYVVVEDMLGTPLSITRDSVKEDSALYDDDKLEEVLAKQGMMLEGLSSYQEQKNYEVAEWRSIDGRHSAEAWMEMKEKTVVKPKEVKLGRRCRSLARCSRPHLPTSVLVPPIVF